MPCIWGIVVYLSSIRDACKITTDVEMENALSYSMERLEGYIVKYSKDPNISHALEKEKREVLDGLQQQAEIQGCDEAQNFVQIYTHFTQHNSAQSLRSEIDEALSLPRADPFDGGCM